MDGLDVQRINEENAIYEDAKRRAEMKIDRYAVTCPECKGKRFIGPYLCETCEGDGHVLIPQVPNRLQGPRLLVAAILFVSLAVVLAWRFL